MREKLRCAVVGATGMVGQRFLTLLENHEYFTVTAVAASSRSAGVTYEKAVEGRWKMAKPIPEKLFPSFIVTIPITFPESSSNGQPEFPGLRGAVVCISLIFFSRREM